jgi:hypothetical protein
MIADTADSSYPPEESAWQSTRGWSDDPMDDYDMPDDMIFWEIVMTYQREVGENLRALEMAQKTFSYMENMGLEPESLVDESDYPDVDWSWRTH